MTIRSILTKSFACSVALATTLYAGSASAYFVDGPHWDMGKFHDDLQNCNPLLLTPTGVLSYLGCKLQWCARHSGDSQCHNDFSPGIK